MNNGVEKYFPADAYVPPLDQEWTPTNTNQKRERGRHKIRFSQINPLDNTVKNHSISDEISSFGPNSTGVNENIHDPLFDGDNPE